ncbi:hypothetical protein ACQP2E_18865 [Actinoplanes sp. CA-015351]|uniref:hypothetical protein n=1 Tax=Actinoplanes sp. CA-015351 TaxID=3239897 RepID=UPI003D985C1D
MIPTAVIATSSTPIVGATAHAAKASAAQDITAGTRRLRSSTSPSGTISRIPAA